MNNLNVLIAHNYYQIPGGEDSVVKNESELLKENNNNVFLYTRHNDEIKSKNLFSKLLLPLETIFSLKTYNEIKKIIKEENIDIIHVHNTLPLISPSIYYAARACNTPIVQTVHNFRLLCPAATFTRENKICEDCLKKGLICAIKHKCYRGSLAQSLVSVINLWIHRIIGTYKRVDGYIALTDFNKKKLEALISEEKIFIKPNFVDFEIEKVINEDEKQYFLFLGRIDKIKGVDLILEAWKNIKDEELYIVGTGPFEAEAKKYVNKNNMSNVKFLGFKEKNEVKSLIENSKALIMASQWYEGFPMTILESFALGVPVISGEIGNMASIIKNYKNGLLYKYDSSEDLVNKINIIKDLKLRSNLAKEARNTFITNYNKEKNYEVLMDIYNKVIENK